MNVEGVAGGWRLRRVGIAERWLGVGNSGCGGKIDKFLITLRWIRIVSLWHGSVITCYDNVVIYLFIYYDQILVISSWVVLIASCLSPNVSLTVASYFGYSNFVAVNSFLLLLMVSVSCSWIVAFFNDNHFKVIWIREHGVFHPKLTHNPMDEKLWILIDESISSLRIQEPGDESSQK